MKKLEAVLLVLVCAVTALDLFAPYFAGKHIATVWAILLLSIIYFWFGFLFFNGIGFSRLLQGQAFQGISASRIIGAIGFGVSLAILLMGILFKLMDWPGASAMLLSAFVPTLLIAIAAAVKYFISKDVYYSRILVRSVVFGGIAVLLYTVSPMVWIRFNYPGNPEVQAAYEHAYGHPEDQQVYEKIQQAKDKAINADKSE